MPHVSGFAPVYDVRLVLKVPLPDVKIADAAPDRFSEIVRLLMSARIGAAEDWSADRVTEATIGEDLVGCCAVDFVENVAILHSLAIEKPMRRRGIGRALVEGTVEIARARHAECIVALTMFWNVNFFRKCGFVTTSRKLLPGRLAGHPFIFDPAFRHATPMIRQIDGSG
jgi:N-acetylglutamate synthase-like GNAT family acetyltransferase